MTFVLRAQALILIAAMFLVANANAKPTNHEQHLMKKQIRHIESRATRANNLLDETTHLVRQNQKDLKALQNRMEAFQYQVSKIRARSIENRLRSLNNKEILTGER